MRLLAMDVEALQEELTHVLALLEDDNVSDALDELECQRGTIDTILTNAGR